MLKNASAVEGVLPGSGGTGRDGHVLHVHGARQPEAESGIAHPFIFTRDSKRRHPPCSWKESVLACTKASRAKGSIAADRLL